MKHLYFNSGWIEDKPEIVLAEIERCLEQMKEFRGCYGLIRAPLQVLREKQFDSDRTMAMVFCRFSGITEQSSESNELIGFLPVNI